MNPIELPNSLSNNQFITWPGMEGFLWYLLAGLGIIAAIFFLTISYHWLRYETQNKLTPIIISVNAIVLTLLIGGAANLLSNYLITA
jgi:hypothetical protein